MKVDYKKIESEIRKLEKNKKRGNKISITFSIVNNQVVFSGHEWASNCSYSISDLVRNKDFMIERDCDGSIQVLGCEASLTQETKLKLLKISERY